MKKLKINGKESNNYLVSKEGHVYNIEGKQLKEHITNSGYYRVRLCRDIPRGMYSVHRIVAETYIDNPEEKPIVNHLDNTRTNNEVTNLEWVTNSENQLQRFSSGGHKGTKRRPVQQYSLSGEYIRTWESAIDVTKELNIANQNIMKVCKGQRKSAGGYVWKYD